MEEWKKTRDIPLLKQKIAQLYDEAKKGEKQNLMPAIIEAVRTYGTAGEIMGVIRMAYGYHYDPLEMIECPLICHDAIFAGWTTHFLKQEVYAHD